MPPLHETAVAPRVLVWTLGGDTMPTSYGTNCVAVLGDDAVLLVDPLIAPAHARLVEAALREKTSAPVRFVVLTHHHTDHALGSSWFARQGAVVVAHSACREAMAAEHPPLIERRRADPALRTLFEDAESVLPTVTVEESLTLFLDETMVEVWHSGWGHTPGDVFLFLPRERVAVCGDLLFCGFHYNYEDASMDGVRRGLQALRSLDADVFIPGHGPPGGPEVLDAQAAYHDSAEAMLTEAVREGRDAETVTMQMRERFPGHRLEIVIPMALDRFRKDLAAPDDGGDGSDGVH